MILARDTVCNLIEIRSPRWKERVVGIANYRIGLHNEIRITAKNKNGELYYPNPLYASGEMIRSHETQRLPSGVTLHLVPIAELETLERE